MKFDDVFKIKNNKVRISKFKEKNLKKELIEKTNFLNINANIGERLYCLDNNITSKQICKICDNQTKYLKSSKGYSIYCSTKCLSNDDDIKNKKRKTCIKKYGVSSFTKTKEYLDKTKKTNLEKYNKEFYLQTEDKKTKTEKTNLDKFGVIHHMKSNDFINKFKQLNINKFGVDNVSKLDNIKEQKRQTFQKNYGLDNVFCSNKLKGEYMFKKYGYNPFIPDELKSDFEKYKNEVWRITFRLKKKLINEWDGFDYYDNEYIKENYKLNYNDNKYPTIDHKISIYYGFNEKLDTSVISDIENLCITKKEINRLKNIKNENEFKNDFNI